MLTVTFCSQNDVLRRSEQSQAGDRQFSCYNYHNHPGRYPVEPYEGDKGRTNHYLIGEWIHKNTEICDKFAAARDLAIEKVRDSSGNKECQRDSFVEADARKHHDQKSNCKNEPGDSQLVRQIHSQCRQVMDGPPITI